MSARRLPPGEAQRRRNARRRARRKVRVATDPAFVARERANSRKVNAQRRVSRPAEVREYMRAWRKVNRVRPCAIHSDHVRGKPCKRCAEVHLWIATVVAVEAAHYRTVRSAGRKAVAKRAGKRRREKYGDTPFKPLGIAGALRRRGADV